MKSRADVIWPARRLGGYCIRDGAARAPFEQPPLRPDYLRICAGPGKGTLRPGIDLA